MKINILKYLFIAGLVLALTSLVSCSDDTITYEEEIVIVDQYLNLSSYSYTFTADSENTLTLNIDSSADWSYDLNESSWVKLESQGTASVTISVEENSDTDKRQETITFTNEHGITAKIRIAQLGIEDENEYADFYINDAYSVVYMSPLGRCIAYVEEEVISSTETSEVFEYRAILVDLTTGKKTITMVSNDPFELCAVSDNGVVVVDFYANSGETFYYQDGQIIELSVPAGYNYVKIDAISSDGSIMVGHVTAPGNYSWAVKWVSGDLQILGKPELDLDGLTMDQVFARTCSADGSMVYGTTYNYPNFMVVYWDDNNEMHYAAENLLEVVKSDPWDDYWGNTYVDIAISGASNGYNPYFISPNGKYICFKYQKTRLTGNGTYTQGFTPVFYDRETSTLLSDMGVDGGVQSITDDGIGFYTTPSYGASAGYAYDTNTDTRYSAADWISTNFGIEVPSGSMIIKAGENNKSLLGMSAVTTGLGVQYKYWVINNF